MPLGTLPLPEPTPAPKAPPGSSGVISKDGDPIVYGFGMRPEDAQRPRTWLDVMKDIASQAGITKRG